MKNGHILGLFLFGIVLIIIGTFLKISHLSYGTLLLGIGMIFEVISILLFIVKLFLNKNTTSFLNK